MDFGLKAKALGPSTVLCILNVTLLSGASYHSWIEISQYWLHLLAPTTIPLCYAFQLTHYKVAKLPATVTILILLYSINLLSALHG